MSGPKIVVVGSSNIDMVVKALKIPQGGETVLGESFVMVPGGKGAKPGRLRRQAWSGRYLRRQDWR